MAWVLWSGDAGAAAPWLLSFLVLPVIGFIVWLLAIRVEAALITLIGAAALSRYYVEIGGLKARPGHISIGLLCLAAPFLWKRLAKPATWIFPDYLLLGYIVANYASSLFMSVAPGQTAKWATQQTIVILAYFLLRIIAGQQKTFSLAIRILVGVGAIEAGYALICFFSNLLFNSEFGVEIGQYGTFPGTYGTTYEANLLGAFSAATFILSLTLYFKEKRGILLLASLLSYAGLLISLSRAAILASIAVLAILGYVGFRMKFIQWRTIRAVTTAIVAISLLLAPAVIPLYIERFSTVEISDVSADPDTALRFLTLATAADDILQHPILGNGTSSFQLLVSYRELGFTDVDMGTWIGNTEMRVIHDTGLLGFGLFVTFIASLGWAGWKLLHRQENNELLALLLSGVVYCITFQATEGTLLAFSWVHLGLIGCGISIAMQQMSIRSAIPTDAGLP
jgi:hypothetical protein